MNRTTVTIPMKMAAGRQYESARGGLDLASRMLAEMDDDLGGPKRSAVADVVNDPDYDTLIAIIEGVVEDLRGAKDKVVVAAAVAAGG